MFFDAMDFADTAASTAHLSRCRPIRRWASLRHTIKAHRYWAGSQQGIYIWTVVPWSISLSIFAVPPHCVAKPSTIDRPKPVGNWVIKLSSVLRGSPLRAILSISPGACSAGGMPMTRMHPHCSTGGLYRRSQRFCRLFRCHHWVTLARGRRDTQPSMAHCVGPHLTKSKP